MFLVQVNDRDGILKELVHVGVDHDVATLRFLEACDTSITNWGEYSQDDVSDVLDDGYAKFGGGCVMFIDTDGVTSDEAIRDQLMKQPAGDVTITEVVQDGELTLTEGMTVDKIINACGANLNAACSWDIQGQILFKGSTGKWYTVTTESVVAEANQEWVKEVLAELAKEKADG